MPYRHRRACPICGKPNLLNLSGHLRQVHGLWSEDQRVPWLRQASHLPPPVDSPMEEYPLVLSSNSYPVDNNNNTSPVPCLTDHRLLPPVHVLETQPYPDFAFQHPYSMMVVGPSQCGKTHFVHQLLTHKCITYPHKKPILVCWYYNQWQPRYEAIQRDLKNKIRFVQGLPELADDLSDIKPSKHTIIVLDDLMAQATDSPVVSKLFTQGRHRNASVLLLLQNMFPKGKYNTDISRNATYKVLFRSPGDRKQIDIMAEQTFAKDRPRFMQAYKQETDRPYGYLVVDNHPRTTSERQVVANVFGDCYTYPHITSTSPPSQTRVEPLPPPLPEQPVTISRKRQAPVINQSEVKLSKKRKAVQKALVINQSEVRATKKRKAFPKRVSVTRKQPVHDSTDEEDEEIVNPKTKRELKQSWLRLSEQDTDSEEEEQEEVDEELDPEEGDENFKPQSQWKGGPGRIVYEDYADMSPEQATLKHAFYNPHLHPPMRCGYRAGGFGPRSIAY